MGKKAAEKAKDDEAAPEWVHEFQQYDLLPKMTPFLDRHLVFLLLDDARKTGLYKKEHVTRSILNVIYEAFMPNEQTLNHVTELYQSLGEEVEEKWSTLFERKSRKVNELEPQVMPLLKVFEDEALLAKTKTFKCISEMCDKLELEPESVESLVPYAKASFEAVSYDMAYQLLSYYSAMPKPDPYFYVIKYVGFGEIVGQVWSNRDDAEEAFERTAAGMEFKREADKARDKDDKAGESPEEQRKRKEEEQRRRKEEDMRCVILVNAVESGATTYSFEELRFSGKSRERVPDLQAWWEEELVRKRAADATKERNVIWGLLASSLLMSDNNEVCVDPIVRMDQLLDNAEKAAEKPEEMTVRPEPRREILLQRTWLLHWALFAIFRIEKVDMKVVDIFVSNKSMSVISLSCPHLFRYVGACLILHKRLKHTVKDYVENLPHLQVNSNDPITRFLLAVYQDMDYDQAQHELQRCELLCKGDYFLKEHWQELQQNARLHIFESYCRIHQCINIQMLAEKLNMQAEEAELWIVKLIQNAKLDARIDSEKSRVVMTKAPPNVYQQVIEKTKNLAFRSTMLVSNLEKSN